MHQATIIMAEGQRLVRTALRQLLQTDSRFRVVASFDNGRAVLDYLDNAAHLPDLCLLDANVPVLDGLQCAERIRKLGSGIKIVLLSSVESEDMLEKALKIGVNGYIPKSANAAGFTAALEQILDGQFVAPWHLLNRIADRWRKITERENSDPFKEKLPILANHDVCDVRDLELIRLIWLGWSNRMIANHLRISQGTVKNCITRIYRKLNINKRSELMRLLDEPGKPPGASGGKRACMRLSDSV